MLSGMTVEQIDNRIEALLTLAAELWMVAHPEDAEYLVDSAFATSSNGFLPLAEGASIAAAEAASSGVPL